MLKNYNTALSETLCKVMWRQVQWYLVNVNYHYSCLSITIQYDINKKMYCITIQYIFLTNFFKFYALYIAHYISRWLYNISCYRCLKAIWKFRLFGINVYHILFSHYRQSYFCIQPTFLTIIFTFLFFCLSNYGIWAAV